MRWPAWCCAPSPTSTGPLGWSASRRCWWGCSGSGPGTPTRLEATGPLGHALNLAVFLVLYLLEPTSDAALIFYGASLWLAALWGYAGCEVLAASNWLLGRDDQVGCALFCPSTSGNTTEAAGGQPRLPCGRRRLSGARRWRWSSRGAVRSSRSCTSRTAPTTRAPWRWWSGSGPSSASTPSSAPP